MITPQYFGDKVNAHAHLHALVTDGAFDAEGNFYRLPIDELQFKDDRDGNLFLVTLHRRPQGSRDGKPHYRSSFAKFLSGLWPWTRDVSGTVSTTVSTCLDKEQVNS